MNEYQLPERSPYDWPFRVASGILIAALTGVLLFSLYQPENVTDRVNHSVGWASIGVIALAVMGALAFAAKEGTWKFQRAYKFTISDGKIIRAGKNQPTVEIPLCEISDLREIGPWLVVGGGEPRRSMAIPRQVIGYEQLRKDLAGYCELSAPGSKFNWMRVIPILLIAAALAILAISQKRAMVASAAIVVFLIQITWLNWLRGRTRGKKLPARLTAVFVLSWLILGWLVYQRFTTES